MRHTLLLVFILTGHFFVHSQNTQKQFPAIRRDLPIVMDGMPDEEAWKKGLMPGTLTEMRPTFGRPEMEATRSSFYLLYDDEAIYFAGFCRESTRDSITTQLAGRDEIGINDFAGLILDTYQDKINALSFFVTPLNEQFDIKYGTGSEDGSWNAVYETRAKIHDNGWSFEMKIPYAAVRFSKDKLQDWNIQVLRRRSRTGQQYSWSPVDPTHFGFVNQFGTWTGLRDIRPPLRLSFSPYLSSYLTKDASTENQWRSTASGGMDVKYGISDAFTMDMTLIPDFGQVQSDNQVLNLSPFEVKFNENRPFFNEGTELFSQGDLFYSRRIGGQPLHYYDVDYDRAGGETIRKNPAQTKLLNATKISGRTKNKLGIGLFNAITRSEYATVEKADKQTYQVQTSPLTNYNIAVLDQALPHNSRVTLINTNVWRSGKDYDANVTALDWDLYDKNIKWNVWGKVAHSRLIGYEAPGKTYSGNQYELFFGKFKGRFNFDIHRWYVDSRYNQSDMGYFTNNNYLTHGFYAGYKWVKPKSFYNNIYININGNYSQLQEPRLYQDLVLSGNVNGQMKNLWNVGVELDYRARSNDYYDARLDGYVLRRPASWMKGIWLRSNKAKKYTLSAEFYHRLAPRFNGNFSEISFGNNYRFSDKLNIGLNNYVELQRNDYGFAYLTSVPGVVIGLRDRRTISNTLDMKYSFTNRMGVTVRLRHYWSKVHFTQLFDLSPDGHTTEVVTTTPNPDYNINFFNIDMVYTWQFAPGSFLNIGWKNAGQLSNQLVRDSYYRNLRNTLDNPMFNSISLRLIYFLDYQEWRKNSKIKSKNSKG